MRHAERLTPAEKGSRGRGSVYRWQSAGFRALRRGRADSHPRLFCVAVTAVIAERTRGPVGEGFGNRPPCFSVRVGSRVFGGGAGWLGAKWFGMSARKFDCGCDWKVGKGRSGTVRPGNGAGCLSADGADWHRWAWKSGVSLLRDGCGRPPFAADCSCLPDMNEA